jgi:UDP-N-acetylglucosamine 3-dehydrogenase
METLRGAVIGAGEMGRHHIRALSEMEGVELAGVVDPDPGSLARGVKGRSAMPFSSIDAMLAEVKPDFVVAAVPTKEHVEVALAAIAAGVHVLVEKPVADTIEGARRIQKQARSNGVIVSVGHIERFNPAIIELRRQISAGTIGRAFQVVARRTGPFPSRVKDVGVVKDLATHDLDVIDFVFDSRFVSVASQLAQHLHEGHEDLAVVLGRLENGTIALLDINWLTPTKVREFRVVGEGGMLVANYLLQELTLFRNSEHGGEFGGLEAFTGVSEGEATAFSIQRHEPLRLELQAFLSAIRDGGSPPVSIDSAIRALAMSDRILDSAATP